MSGLFEFNIESVKRPRNVIEFHPPGESPDIGDGVIQRKGARADEVLKDDPKQTGLKTEFKRSTP